jgi:hypothetical protein
MGNNASACSCESTGGDADPVFSVLASKGLQGFYGKVTSDLGVNTVQHLRMLTDADLDRIGMKSVQKQLLKELVTEIRTSKRTLSVDEEASEWSVASVAGSEPTASGSTPSQQLRAGELGESESVQALQLDAAASAGIGSAAARAELTVDTARLDSLRAELQQLKASQLEKRAVSGGVSEEQVEEAKDAEVPKDALTALIFEFESAKLTSSALVVDTARLDSLRAELQQLKASQLEKRAISGGVSEEQVEEAKDAEVPKDALAALIFEFESAKLTQRATEASDCSRPHYGRHVEPMLGGAPPRVEPAPQQPTPLARDGKHWCESTLCCPSV